MKASRPREWIFAVLVFCAVLTFWTVRDKRPNPVRTGLERRLTNTAPTSHKLSPLVMIPNHRSDPFGVSTSRRATNSASIVSKKPPVMTLSGIWIQDTRAWAVINQEILRQGDSLEGYQLERCERDCVWMRHGKDGSRFPLFLCFSGDSKFSHDLTQSQSTSKSSLPP